MLNAHCARIAAEWETAKRKTRAAVAKADKTAAERALGTLPGVE